MLRMGVIGYGYWGPNIVRNFFAAADSQVTMVCDMNQKTLVKVKNAYQQIHVTIDSDELIQNSKIDAIAIATPVFTHYDLAKKALEAGKCVFMEKPFTYTVAEAEDLVELAAKKNLKIMVDHTFLYTGAVRKIRQLIDEDVLGKIYYFDSSRVNLRASQPDDTTIKNRHATSSCTPSRWPNWPSEQSS